MEKGFSNVQWHDLPVPYLAGDATMLSRGELGDIGLELWVDHASQAETRASLIVVRPGKDRLDSRFPSQWDAITRAVGEGWTDYLDSVDLTPYYPARYKSMIGKNKPVMIMDSESRAERDAMVKHAVETINENWELVQRLELEIADAKSRIDDTLILAMEWKINPRQLHDAGAIMQEQTMRNRRFSKAKQLEKLAGNGG